MSQFEAREIGQRIAEARRVAGLTQEALAEMASFSKRSLQDYEAGVTIPYQHMREISQLLDRRVDWFLYGKEPVSDDRLEGLAGKVDDLAAQVSEGFAVVGRRLQRLEQRLPGEEAPEAQADEDV